MCRGPHRIARHALDVTERSERARSASNPPRDPSACQSSGRADGSRYCWVCRNAGRRCCRARLARTQALVRAGSRLDRSSRNTCARAGARCGISLACPRSGPSGGSERYSDLPGCRQVIARMRVLRSSSQQSLSWSSIGFSWALPFLVIVHIKANRKLAERFPKKSEATREHPSKNDMRDYCEKLPHSLFSAILQCE